MTATKAAATISGNSETDTTSSLADILAPMSSDEFLQHYFGKSFLHIPGPTEKFSKLVPWNELNRILEEHRLGPPRLRLTQSGKDISPDKYRSKPDDYGTRLDSTELTNLLAQGATLIVSAFDELYRPVGDLAIALERVFRIYVGVNLYAGWRTDQGFLLHYDDHDTVILQISGRKHWKVYRPTRLYPLRPGSDVEVAEKPDGEPIWDSLLDSGGMFYIPRGWWHVAYPVDEPTLHLTVGLRNYRGLDFLLWLVKQLKNCVEIRQDIPHLADRNTQAVYLEELRNHLLSRWPDDLFEGFLNRAEDGDFMRPDFQLPAVSAQEGVIVRMNSLVRLSRASRLHFPTTTGGGDLRLRWAGKTVHFRETLLPIIEKLFDGQYHTVGELTSLTSNWKGDALNFLQGMVMEKILIAVPETAGNFADGRGRDR